MGVFQKVFYCSWGKPELRRTLLFETANLGIRTHSLPTVLAFLILSFHAQTTFSQLHTLPPAGADATNIEAESYSASSGTDPNVIDCATCSGGSAVGNFSFGTWFEMQVESPQMLNYNVSLAVATPNETLIEVRMISATGETLLTTIQVPNTGGWFDFEETASQTISVPAGAHTLRFTNVQESTNVDFAKFTPGTGSEVVAQAIQANAGPDINPFKGWMSGWWRPNEDHASVGYQTIEWGRFEPEDGVYDWDYIENHLLNRPGTQGRHFILQFVCDWDTSTPVEANYLGPDWLLNDLGVAEFLELEDLNDPTSRLMRATDYDDAIFIAKATAAIEALLERYKNDPRAFVIQVGVLGFWGEWHNFPKSHWEPEDSTKQAILDAYFNNMEDDNLTQVRFPEEPINVPQWRMGYTNGSVVLTDHGREYGDRINADGTWVNGPIGGEWPPNVDDVSLWQRFFATTEGTEYIDIGHYSTILPPELPEIATNVTNFEQNGQFMEMHRQMGYNFRATDVRYLVSSDISNKVHIEVDLQNDGIAPFYKNWKVQLAAVNATTGEANLVDLDYDIRTLGVGETTTLAGTCELFQDPNSDYQIGFRIVQPGAEDAKDADEMLTRWNLLPRNLYVVLANDVDVSEGAWDFNNALVGGWNILDDIGAEQVTETSPNSFSVFRGLVVSGDLSALLENDETKLSMNPGFILNTSEAPVWLALDGALSNSNPAVISFVRESNANTPGLTATTDIWNWNTGSFDEIEVVDESFNTDAIVTSSLSGDISSYVAPSTGNIRSRVGWRQTGFTILYPWKVSVDYVAWETSE